MKKLCQAADRVLGKLRIGRMALRAFNEDRRGKTSAAANFDLVAKLARAGRLPHDRCGELFATPRRPFEQLHRAVDRSALLVAGDEERESAAKILSVPVDKAQCRRDHPREP